MQILVRFFFTCEHVYTWVDRFIQHIMSYINKIATTNKVHHKHIKHLSKLKLIHIHLRHDKCKDNLYKLKMLFPMGSFINYLIQ